MTTCDVQFESKNHWLSAADVQRCNEPDVVQGRMYTLPDVWIRPTFSGKGRKVTGQLEAHSNGFRYSTPKGETLDIMYR